MGRLDVERMSAFGMAVWQKERYLVVVYRIAGEMICRDGHAQCRVHDRGGDEEVDEPV
jgi:hypothetical protein